MTDRKQRLAALADRVEQLQGPDREVDAEIYATTSEAIDYQRIAIKLADASRLDRWHDGWVTVRGDKGEGDPYPEDLKPYTASLDAAMTLVPDEQFLRFYADGAQAIIVRPFSGSWREVSRAFGTHYAAVITAAALRAQSETVA